MGRIVRALIALVLIGAAPAIAPATAQPAPSSLQAEQVRAQMLAYGQWLQAANEAVAPASAALTEAQQRYMALQSVSVSERVAALGPVMARLLAEVRRSDERLNALPRPAFPLLNLPAELETATLARDYIALTTAYADAIRSIQALLDPAAARSQQSLNRTIASMQAAIERMAAISVRIFSARQKAVPEGTVGWYSLRVMVLNARIGQAFTRDTVDTGPGIAALKTELRDMAGHLRIAARDGRARQTIEAEEAAQAASANQASNPHGADMARRLVNVIANSSGYFAAAEQMADAIDTYVTSSVRPPITRSPATLQLFQQFQAARAIIEQAAENEARLMTAS